MEEQLSILTNTFLRKRIKRELEILIEKNMCLIKSIDIKQNHYNPKEFILKFVNINNKNHYKFVITSNYPFVPPKLSINEKLISFNHNLENQLFNETLKKYTGIQCFCCETILCSNNWNPGFTFIHIIDDINKYKNARLQVIHRLIIDIIKIKYLIDDINIVEWLY